MNMLRRSLGALMALLLLPFKGKAQRMSKSSTQVGRQLREAFLSNTAESVGLSPTAEYPRVFGAALDWHIGENTATVVSLADGTASLYITSTFGIIGGAGLILTLLQTALGSISFVTTVRGQLKLTSPRSILALESFRNSSALAKTL